MLRRHEVRQPRLRPSWIAASALTVLSAAVVAAVWLPPVPGRAGTAAVASTVAASDVVAPAPLVLSFPPPGAVAPSASPRPRVTSAPRPAQAAPTPVGGRRPAAPPDSRCSGNGWQQRRGAAALASLRRPADAQSFRVEFLPGRSDVLGLAYLQERRVEIFVRSCAELPDGLLRHALAHEIGHLVDASRMTTSLRSQWLSTRGIAAGTPWLGCNGCRDFRTPAGDFAEVYAQWQRGSAGNLSELAPAPAASALDQLAAQFF
ncbi:MAG: hypothetical protein KY451_12155 [Actinobacteria bacterium]|nr:hypothetical protein [Actinomycetota bacterium]MBW3648506.1 hypothetical protein [Actinomycetota bacterium]